MGEMLNYAGTSTPVAARRWPLVVFAGFAVVAGSATLAFNCLKGIKGAGEAGRWAEAEVWARVLVLAPESLILVAVGWWFARRADRGVKLVRNVFLLALGCWVASCAIVAARTAGWVGG